MVTEERSYYEILRIESTASATTIKKAYYKLIREFTNENHPEEFKEIRNAYETLSNEKEKQQYDKELNMGTSHLEAINQIYELIATEKYDEAKISIKKEMVMGGRTNELIILFAKCEFNSGRYHAVHETLSQINNPTPVEQEDVYGYLGSSNYHLGNYQEAEAFGLKLIEMNSSSTLYYNFLRNVYMSQEKYDKVLILIEKMMKNSKVKVEHCSLLIDIFMLQDTIQVPKALIEKTKSQLIKLGKSDNDKQNLVQLIVSDLENYDSEETYTGYYDICEVLTELNVNDDYTIKAYIDEIKRKRPDRVSISTPQENRTDYEPNTNNQHNVSTTNNSSDGNLIIAIILGIFLSIVATPFIGIPAAFIYYSYAKYIWIMVGVIIIIFIVFLSIVSSL